MAGYGLEGKVAFITGGATGIGRATAEVLGSEGANVVIADVNDSEAAITHKLVEAAGGTGLGLHVDVADPQQVADAIAETVATFGRLDAAVNCAAITLGAERRTTVDVPLETFDRLLAVDLRGVFICMKHELRQMIQQRDGSIVNIASAAGVVGTPLNASYVAAKHGVVGLTKAAAVDHAADGVRVNVICPGLTETTMISERPPGYRERIEAGIPMGRTAVPAEIAHAIAWYCSPRASYATGSVVTVDGGYTTR